MRRFTSSLGVTLLALLLSGWGNVLAAALCPHAVGRQQQATVEKAKAHQHGSHQAMDGMPMSPASSAQHCDSNVAAFNQPAGTCAHCFGQNESTTTLASLRALTLKKHDAGIAVEQPATSSTSLTIAFTPQLIPTQHAPPGPANRKHLLLSVFLI